MNKTAVTIFWAGMRCMLPEFSQEMKKFLFKIWIWITTQQKYDVTYHVFYINWKNNSCLILIAMRNHTSYYKAGRTCKLTLSPICSNCKSFLWFVKHMIVLGNPLAIHMYLCNCWSFYTHIYVKHVIGQMHCEI